MADDSIQIVLDDPKLVEFVRAKVRSGEYASEADVIEIALKDLQTEAEELERWEREVVLPAYKAYVADPSTGVPIAEVRREIETRRLERLKAG